MKNKKIIARILALCASLLLIVALAVPCFADEVTDPTQYVLTEVTFSDYNELFTYASANYDLISHVVLADDDAIMLFRPTAKLMGTGVDVLVFVSPIFIGENNTAVNSTTSIALRSEGGTVTLMSGAVNSSLLIQSQTYTAEELSYLTLKIYVYEPAQLTPVPIDPDAPTRTGLYGNLYYIIRDAIFGENALLDASQEFTLTQIATVMTYAVLLLPFIVVAIIFFKLVRL